ncbi:extracellular solute-binding protein [Ferruginivarius sediminum]|uniref:Extracellular solute-binding protein n=1 Tax=Ferruginivarius sediminum TaxID=2661937 RepID=A0A369TEI8_9PROT|nr:extracellular solute-binding protein [Ferruginivarius sediminum]RDD62557.1 extracellular solute-binding protein [Ferruginivarius sediminum]
MKHWLKATTAAVAGTAALGLASASAQAETLTIVSWGGAYTASQQKAYHDPYMEANPDVEIVNEDKSANGLAGVRAQVQAGNVTWDIVDMLEGPALTACAEGIIEPINHDEILADAPDGTPPSEDFVEGSLSECFIPEIVYATLFAYNKEAFPSGDYPSKVADVWDTDTYPGKRSLQKIPAGNMEWALMADGVPAGEVYDVLDTDEGIARAFKKLGELKGNTVWWTEGAQPPQLLADQEVSIATGYNGRFFNAQVVENQPFELMWDGQYFELDGWVIPKGKLTDRVKDYLHFATDTQRLADQAKYISYGPARKSSAPLVSTHAEAGIDMKPHMPTNPKNFENPIKKNAAWWADNGDEMSERFNAWLAR